MVRCRTKVKSFLTSSIIKRFKMGGGGSCETSSKTPRTNLFLVRFFSPPCVWRSSVKAKWRCTLYMHKTTDLVYLCGSQVEKRLLVPVVPVRVGRRQMSCCVCERGRFLYFSAYRRWPQPSPVYSVRNMYIHTWYAHVKKTHISCIHQPYNTLQLQVRMEVEKPERKKK